MLFEFCFYRETRGEGQLVPTGETSSGPGWGLLPQAGKDPGDTLQSDWALSQTLIFRGTAHPRAAKWGDPPPSVCTDRSGLGVLFSLHRAYGTRNSGFVENEVSL